LGKKEILFSGIMFILIVVVMTSGCTSSSKNATTSSKNSNYNSYDNNGLSFQYPKEWNLMQASSQLVRFKTPAGDCRIYLYNIGKSPVAYESFTESATVGGQTYKSMSMSDGSKSYILRENGKDLLIIGMPNEENGVRKIIETVKF
jgi:hypothetical protein